MTQYGSAPLVVVDAFTARKRENQKHQKMLSNLA